MYVERYRMCIFKLIYVSIGISHNYDKTNNFWSNLLHRVDGENPLKINQQPNHPCWAIGNASRRSRNPLLYLFTLPSTSLRFRRIAPWDPPSDVLTYTIIFNWMYIRVLSLYRTGGRVDWEGGLSNTIMFQCSWPHLSIHRRKPVFI